MKAGIIQSSYVPWRGYFDLIASVDVFVLFDDVSFGSRGNWRHRNQLKFGDELRWITVPVNGSSETAIDRMGIFGTGWVAAHHRLLHESLGRAPFFADARRVWEDSVGSGSGCLSELNARLTRGICAYLEIGTRIVDARTYGASGVKTERLLDLLQKVGADSYLSGPSARDYIEPEDFKRAGIRLEYKRYAYGSYPQMGGAFIGSVSVLDLIANCGPEARAHLRSREPEELAVP